ncbi:hypothetical protein [Bacillus sp. T33-2]|uniref:hypothetical protein n=1 Tax=Bacillus sp. T33-2 TaxID=2054168 RepID=UPI0015E07B62|nr:hypothetical protein [Bacillus sp. T33-2]
MGLYQTICHKVENAFVKVLTRKQEPEQVKIKVQTYRMHKEQHKIHKKGNRQVNA